MLTKKYPMVSLIRNPYFESCNNISSLYVAREHLEEAMILDGDQIIYIKDILFRIFIAPVIIASGRKTIQRNGCFQPRGIG